jgi:hypothetical protein
MRFMMMVKGGKDYEAGVPPAPQLISAINELTEKMIKAGVLLDTGGLLPSAAGARIKVKAGEIAVIDGPFTEAKELIGGYAILRASSKDEAIELGKQFMKLHAEVLGPSYDGEMEIRQLADFSPEGVG